MATFKEFRNNVKPNWCPDVGTSPYRLLFRGQRLM